MTATHVQPMNTIKASEHSVIEYMNGPSPKGPKRCIDCHRTFQSGESWQRVISPENPEFGSYAIGIHTSCMK